ncbi:hypothetical protein EYF80_031178 [Liparis tanakae]|uniref:Uncharacterized protein n=1 Tax=Liparis tanakae TaxID=230148 RepID=A0A4Z2GY74_9TELE|nr:hypothetical protein EYF80_031178 [Liparis tanakae]
MAAVPLFIRIAPLTSEVLSGSGQQAVENVEGPLIFGLSDGSGLLQEDATTARADTGDWLMLEDRQKWTLRETLDYEPSRPQSPTKRGQPRNQAGSTASIFVPVALVELAISSEATAVELDGRVLKGYGHSVYVNTEGYWATQGLTALTRLSEGLYGCLSHRPLRLIPSTFSSCLLQIVLEDSAERV